MISLLKYLKGSWDGAKGYLETDLEHIETALNQLETDVFDIDTRTLLAGIIQGNSSVVPRYIANTGKNNAPKWDQVDLGSTGVKNRLPFSHIVQQAASTLVGRGSAAGSGDLQAITLDTTVAMTGTVLGVSTAIFDGAEIALHRLCGGI